MSGCVRALSGQDGSLLWQVCGTNIGERFGASVAAAGDLDGDGRAEIVVAAPGSGNTRIVSGATGIVFRTIPFSSYTVDGGRDFDGDGVADQLCTSWNGTTGSAAVFSGANGSTLLTVANTSYGFTGGIVTASFIADVNADGFDDAILGSPSSFTGVGMAVVVRGPNGAFYGGLAGSWPSQNFGASVHDVGDVTGDGSPDVGVFTHPQVPLQGPELRVYSSQTAAVLWSVPGWVSPGVGPGAGCVARLGDVNGDGTSDLVVGSGFNPFTPAVFPAGATVISGSNGATIFTKSLPFNHSYGTGGVAALPDLTGDGVPEFGLGIPLANASFTDAGRVIVVSCAPLTTASITNLGGACGAYAASLASSPLVLGATSTVSVTGAAPSTSASLVLDIGPDVATPYATCTWHLDLTHSAVWILMPMSIDGFGNASLSIPVPSIPSAVGLIVPMQLFVVVPSSPFGFDVSNGLRAIVGF
jgi:hypothetical protein